MGVIRAGGFSSDRHAAHALGQAQYLSVDDVVRY